MRRTTAPRAATTTMAALAPALLIGALASPPAARAAAAANDQSRYDRLVEALGAPDPFTSGAAELRLRQAGPDALAALEASLGSADRIRRVEVSGIIAAIVAQILLDLESEYQPLADDRLELGSLREREEQRQDLARLDPAVSAWREEDPDILTKIEKVWALRTLRARAAANGEAAGAADSEDAARRLRLEAEVARLREEIPDLDERVDSLERLSRLRSLLSGDSDERREVEALRRQDLEERISEREPRVETLLRRVREIGIPAYAAMAARRAEIPVTGGLLREDIRSPVQQLYEKTLEEALDNLPEASWIIDGDGPFERQRYRLSLLWSFEATRRRARAEEASKLLDRHIAATLVDLDAPESVVRERAGVELFRLGKRALEALKAGLSVDDPALLDPSSGRHAFLAALLRWRIDPRTYGRTGIHFGDYKRLDYTGRRRKIFQYARTAGPAAIPTLRAIVIDDTLEGSFLVKLAAAKALDRQLGDRLGYLVLKALHPEVVLERPELVRDLLLLQGAAYLKSGDHARAVEEYAKILASDPFDFDANYMIAFAYLLMKDFPRSIHHFEIARRIRSGDQLTLYNLACAYSLAGKTSEALDALQASVEAGFTDVEHMNQDTDLDPIRNNPRFRRILETARAAGNAGPP